MTIAERLREDADWLEKNALEYGNIDFERMMAKAKFDRALADYLDGRVFMVPYDGTGPMNMDDNRLAFIQERADQRDGRKMP